MHNKTDMLLKHDQVLFHTGDLALLWNIHKRNTLYTTISRYVKRGVLHAIHKGYYSTVSPEKIKPERLVAGALNRYCYLSTESVLINAGVILQHIQYITYVSSLSKKVSVLGHKGKVRKLANQYLFNPSGIVEKDGLLTADTERAVADLLYFNPNYYFDSPALIDWSKVRQLQKAIGYA